MKKIVLLLLSCYLASDVVFAQKTTNIVTPDFNDKFSSYVKKLESNQTDINYQDFRFSFLDSEQFNVLLKQKHEFDKLNRKMYKFMSNRDYKKSIHFAKKTLSIDYTYMIAHEMLSRSYQLVGDTLNAKKYKDIQSGLLNSIMKNGDGNSCATAWPVIQVSEEHFILGLLGAKIETQNVVNEGGLCDKIDAKVDGQDKTYYFETTKVFQTYIKSGIK